MSDKLEIKVETKGTEAALRKRLAALLALPIALVEEAEEARHRLVDLTARSDLSGQHMADQWFVKASGGGTARGGGGRFSGGAGAGRPTIEIDHPANVVGATHPSRKNSDGSPVVVNDGKHNLLATLEWGSKPHIIKAKNKPYLHFKTADGNWVKTKQVEHKGTRAFGMVRIVSRELRRDVNKRVKQIVSGRKR